MAIADPYWSAFNAGELSPLLDGRVDQEKYFVGCKTLLNFLPTVQGPAVRRAGTRYVGASKSTDSAWLVPFIFSSAQSYVLEFGESYIRFWVNRAQLTSGGPAYEIVSPWTLAQMTNADGSCAIRYAQNGDIVYMCLASGTSPLYKLSRLGATSWTMAAVSLQHGPHEDVEATNTITVAASANTGAITLTASSGIFTAAHVGTVMLLEVDSKYKEKAWESNKSVSSGDRRRYGGNVYLATSTGTTGTDPPIALAGAFTDGGISWNYEHSGFGFVTITGFTSATQVTGTVVTDGTVGRVLPQDVVTGTTKRWAFALFDSTKGYPTDVAFFKNRLALVKGRRVCLSVVGSFEDFLYRDGPDATKETAMNLKVAVKNLDAFRWCAQARSLICGSSRIEVAIQSQSAQTAFASDNVEAEPQHEYGGTLLRSISIGEAVLWLQRGGKRLRETKYDYSIDRHKSEDLTVLSEHILKAGVVDYDFALEPDSALWVVLADGTAASLTYNRERGVVAWARHELGGDAFIESVAVISSPSENRDDVWFLVKRTVNGSTVRYLEYLEDYKTAETSLSDAVYADASIAYSGAPATTITGLGHLEGATVQVLADGRPHGDCVVSGGQITLNRSASKVQVGFGYTSVLQTMRPERAAPGMQAGQFRRRATGEVGIRLDTTVGGKFGPSLTALDLIPYETSGTVYNSGVSAFSGDRLVQMPAQVDTDGYTFVVQDQALPMTVVAIRPRMDVN